MISPDDVKTIQKTSEKVLLAARAIGSSMGRTSITRLAKDAIMQFPGLFSSGIPSDEAITMSRAIERYYASAMVSILSMRTVDLNKNDDIAQYLKRFHNNSDIPSNILAASTFLFESASYIDDPNASPTSDDVMACWNITTEQIDTQSLNDIYRPYDNTKQLLSDKLNQLKAANEASVVDVLKDKRTEQILQKIGSMGNNDNNDMGYSPKSTKTTTTTMYDEKGNKKGETKNDETTIGAPVVPNTFNSVVRNDKLAALEPTMTNIQFIVHGDGKKFIQDVVLGFKVMVRIIRSDLMVANMVEAAKNSNAIFKFIKWTKGEYKFVRDLLFNASEIKDTAVTNSEDKNFLKALKRRQAVNNVTKFFDNRVPPSTMIVMTSYEVAQVAEKTGVNLAELHNALNMLNKYYLIGFGIYDTETKILSTIFDGDSEFGDVTIESLRTGTEKNSDKISINNAMKMFGHM